MSKFKVGDKVVVREDMYAGAEVGEFKFYFDEEMLQYRGKEYTVEEIFVEWDGGEEILLKEIDDWVFCDEMLRSAEREAAAEMKVYDVDLAGYVTALTNIHLVVRGCDAEDTVVAAKMKFIEVVERVFAEMDGEIDMSVIAIEDVNVTALEERGEE